MPATTLVTAKPMTSAVFVMIGVRRVVKHVTSDPASSRYLPLNRRSERQPPISWLTV